MESYKDLQGIEYFFEIDIENFSDSEPFKINLPETKEGFVAGKGEGVWAICDKKDYSKWTNDSSVGEKLIIKILNDSIYYENLFYGTPILVETRGDKRPLALLEELEFYYKKSNWRDYL